MTQDVIGEPDPSFWTNKTVLVTGSGGFAGSHLAERLHELGANVRCFVRAGETAPLSEPRAETVVGDVQEYQSLLKALEETDVAFHLAAITAIPEAKANVFDTFATNSLGTLNLLMAARERKVSKVVYVSTGQVYGRQNVFPITESALPRPLDIYSASKLSAETLALSFAEMYGLSVSISRAFNHYGPRQRPRFLIPEVILQLLKGKAIEVRNPTATRDFTYVDDIVRGYILLAEKGRTSETYHFCSGVERSVSEVVDTVARLSSSRVEVRTSPGRRSAEIPRSFGDYSKARKELGWSPNVSLDEGIMRSIEWYRTHMNG